MAIPDFQSLMLPPLQLAGDDEEHSIGETVQRLADESSLTADERPSTCFPAAGRLPSTETGVAAVSSYVVRRIDADYLEQA